MKKRTIKTVVIIVLVSIVVLMFWSAYVGNFESVAQFNTEFTKSFSNEKFEKVKVGMTEKEVKTMLGEPFETKNNWLYYSKSKPSNQVFPPFAGDWWWVNALIILDEHGKVKGKALNRFFN